MMVEKRPIIIAAGGTGGHFFPAEALAAELIKRGERVVLFTDTRSGGLNSKVFAQTEKYVIAGAGLAGRGVGRAAKGAIALAKGIVQARALLQRLKPKAVVAFGGYPSVPPVAATALISGAKPFIVLHEQNAVLGRANRFLSSFADLLALNFSNTKRLPIKKIETMIVGNPVRPAIVQLFGQGYESPAGTIELLVMGGSLGAKIFSTLIPQALAQLPQTLRARLHVTQQCRVDDLESTSVALQKAGIKAELSPFFNDVAGLLKRAHLVITRAGASSVAEIALAARPAIFIPLPSAIDDHQRANADALALSGGALRLDQATLTPNILAKEIETFLMNPESLKIMAEACAKMGQPNSASQLADLVQERAKA